MRLHQLLWLIVDILFSAESKIVQDQHLPGLDPADLLASVGTYHIIDKLHFLIAILGKHSRMGFQRCEIVLARPTLVRPKHNLGIVELGQSIGDPPDPRVVQYQMR